MNKIKILITFDLPKQYIEKIQQISKDITIQVCSKDTELTEMVKDTNILFVGKFSKQMFLASQKLKWIHYIGSGIDKQIFPELMKTNIILTNSRGVFSKTISEHVLMFILMFSRKMNLFFKNQSKKQWDRLGGYVGENLEQVEGKTLGIIGFGSVGLELAKKAKCLGMIVIATKRTPLEFKPAFLDKFTDLNQLLKEADYIVLTLPLTQQSKGLIGKDELKTMKKTAYLINVSRGEIIKETELVEALEKNLIAGAALDTFEEEPLRQENKLWLLNNIIITPHVAGISKTFVEDSVNLFCENLALFLNSKPLINRINRENGY